jgi:putative transposase
LERVPDWREFLAGGTPREDREALRKHERTGRPLGGESFLQRIERCVGRSLARRKPGRKPKAILVSPEYTNIMAFSVIRPE